MKKLLTGILLFLLSHQGYSQNYAAVDELVDTYPKEFTDSGKLAALINKDFSQQEEKARAIFRWVATNISYDVDMDVIMESKSVNAFSYTTEKEKQIKEKKFKADLVAQTLISKKAVCHGYAALVEELCQKTGLEAQTITGDLKSDPSQIGELPGINHAWNVVKIANSWRFLDATLAAGFINSRNTFEFYFNEAYFFTNPEKFFLNHFPANEKWLLVPKTKKEYVQLPVFFGFYLQSDFVIVKPITGIYSIADGDFILSIHGLAPTDYISYSFETENKRAYLEEQDNSKDFTISLQGRKPDNLYIFINGKIVAMYKIIV
jgi:transglutaminase/protease-like cytokinesis protein 3